MNCIFKKIFLHEKLIQILNFGCDIKKIIMWLLIFTVFYIILCPTYKFIKQLLCKFKLCKKCCSKSSSTSCSSKTNNGRKFRKLTSESSCSACNHSTSSESSKSCKNCKTKKNMKSKSSTIHVNKTKINNTLRKFKII